MIPSITRIQMGLFQWLATHPLVRSQLIRDLSTDEPVDISIWRLRDGLIEKQKTLYCSILPFFGDRPGPISSTVTGRYEKMEISRAGFDHAHYLFNIKLDYAALPFKNLDFTFPVEDPKRLRRSEFLPDELNFSLAVHPGLHIIGEYLELLRVAITDPRIEFQSPFLQVKPPQALHLNLKAEPWNTDTNVIWHTGTLMLSVEAFIDRKWIIEVFNKQPVQPDFNLELNPVDD